MSVKPTRDGKRNPYGALGVERGASPDQIKKAFRKLAMDLHPDRNPGNKQAEAEFKELNEAYDILKDEQKRAAFDRFGTIDPSERGYNSDEADGEAWDDIFEDLLRKARRESDPYGRHSAGRGGADWGRTHRKPEDSKKTASGAGFSKKARKKSKKKGEFSLELSLREAVFGGACTVSLPDGVRFTVELDPGMTSKTVVEVVLRNALDPYGRPTRIRLKIAVKKDKLFTVKGKDVYVQIPISLRQAVLGGQISVPTLQNSVKVNLKPRMGSSGKFRLKGYGLPGGDQIVEYQLSLSKAAEPELEDFLKSWIPRDSSNV